jgi:integrase/recombinase XerD
MEDRGLARATIGRRLSTIAGFYRFAVIDGAIEHSPAEHVRRPKIDTESATLGLDRMELGAFIAQGAAAGATDYALACLLGLLGLRVSEALNIDIEHLPSNVATAPSRFWARGPSSPLSRFHPRSDERSTWSRANVRAALLLGASGDRLNPQAAARIVRRLAKRAGVTKHISPHSLRHSFITAALDAGVPLRDVQIAARHADPRTTTRYDRARNNLDRHANYAVTAFIAGAS